MRLEIASNKKIYDTSKKVLLEVRELPQLIKNKTIFCLADIQSLSSACFNLGLGAKFLQRVAEEKGIQREIAEEKFPLDKNMTRKEKRNRKQKIREEMKLIQKESEEMSEEFFSIFEDYATILDFRLEMEEKE